MRRSTTDDLSDIMDHQHQQSNAAAEDQSLERSLQSHFQDLEDKVNRYIDDKLKRGLKLIIEKLNNSVDTKFAKIIEDQIDHAI